MARRFRPKTMKDVSILAVRILFERLSETVFMYLLNRGRNFFTIFLKFGTNISFCNRWMSLLPKRVHLCLPPYGEGFDTKIRFFGEFFAALTRNFKYSHLPPLCLIFTEIISVELGIV